MRLLGVSNPPHENEDNRLIFEGMKRRRQIWHRAAIAVPRQGKTVSLF